MEDYSTILNSVLAVDTNIVGAAAIINEKVIVELRTGAPKIEESDLVRMATQAQQAISIGKTNQKLLGELQCVVFYHKHITAMLFPLDTFHVVAVGVGRIPNIEQVTFRIKRLLAGY